MKEMQKYERPQMEVLDIDREDAILTSGAEDNERPTYRLCPFDRARCMVD